MQTVSGQYMIKQSILILTLSFCGVLASIWLGIIWTNNVLSKTTFLDYYGLNTLMIATWLPTIIVFLFIGIFLKLILKDINNFVWPFSLGIIAGLLWLSLRKAYFVKEPDSADILWAYSELLMPAAGCILGWWVCKTAKKITEQVD